MSHPYARPYRTTRHKVLRTIFWFSPVLAFSILLMPAHWIGIIMSEIGDLYRHKR